MLTQLSLAISIVVMSKSQRLPFIFRFTTRRPRAWPSSTAAHCSSRRPRRGRASSTPSTPSSGRSGSGAWGRALSRLCHCRSSFSNFLWGIGRVNPASWLLQGVNCKFTQPRAQKIAYLSAVFESKLMKFKMTQMADYSGNQLQKGTKQIGDRRRAALECKEGGRNASSCERSLPDFANQIGNAEQPDAAQIWYPFMYLLNAFSGKCLQCDTCMKYDRKLFVASFFSSVSSFPHFLDKWLFK